MSKIVFRCLLLIILSIFITSNVFAQDITVEANYNAANGVVTLNGYSVGNTIIKTLPFSIAEGSVTSSGQLTDIDQIYCEGYYTYSYPMPVNAPYMAASLCMFQVSILYMIFNVKTRMSPQSALH